jgi:uncharacterized protein
MRWQKRTVRALNQTRGTVLGEHIRVADNGLTRIVGLLGERGLQPGDGLWIVPSQGVHTLGMLFPIDVGILDAQWRVLAIRHALRPFRITKVLFQGASVIELPAGTLKATRTEVGDALEFTRAGQ